MTNEPINPTVAERQEKDKKMLLEILKEIPVIQVACKKAGIGRATYYRWRKEDANFLIESEEALKQGIELINDMSESQLIALIKEKKMPAITFWLRSNNQRYSQKTKTAEPTKESTPENKRRYLTYLKPEEEDFANQQINKLRDEFETKLKPWMTGQWRGNNPITREE